MTWFDLLTTDFATLRLKYGCVDQFAKRGFVLVPEKCQDGKVALTSGVNQTVLLDLETGEFENLIIAV